MDFLAYIWLSVPVVVVVAGWATARRHCKTTAGLICMSLVYAVVYGVALIAAILGLLFGACLLMH